LTGTDRGDILFFSRRYDDAVKEARRVISVEPENVWARFGLAIALIASAKLDEAIESLERLTSGKDQGPAELGLLARAYALAGRPQDALRLLDELHRRRQQGSVPSAAFLNAYLGLGDKERAFDWLERAVEERSNIVKLLKVHPLFDPLRGDPRFASYLRRANLQ